MPQLVRVAVSDLGLLACPLPDAQQRLVSPVRFGARVEKHSAAGQLRKLALRLNCLGRRRQQRHHANAGLRLGRLLLALDHRHVHAHGAAGQVHAIPPQGHQFARPQAGEGPSLEGVAFATTQDLQIDTVQVLLWSNEQHMFHIESLADMLTANLQSFVAGTDVGYAPLFLGSEEEIEEVLEKLRPKLAERWNAKNNPNGDRISYEQLP